MKTLLLALAVTLALSAPLAAGSTNELAATLKQGLLEEEANRNLKAAIAAYQQVITRFDQDRKTAATALYRLGECYRKLGRTNDAIAQFERLEREFADDHVLAQLSQNNLDALRPAGRPNVLPDALHLARAEQKRLFEEEIKIATTELEIVRRQFANGAADQASVLAKERELLRLRREAAALDRYPDLHSLEVQPSANRPPAVDATAPSALATPPGDTAEEDAEIRRIQALVQNSPDLINALAKEGLAPLHLAATRGHRLVVRYLLDHGADPNRKSSRQETPLHLATLAGHNAIVQLLLASEAEVQAADRQGFTSLHLAARLGFKAVAETLLAHQADPNATSLDGRTPLHEAAGSGFLDLAEILLARHGSVDAPTQNGRTPLHYAVAQNHPALVDSLLTHGANLGARTRNGETPLALAINQRARATATLLLERKADPNAPDADGQPPLSLAIETDAPEIAKALLAAGADPNRSDPSYGSPLLRAVRNGRTALVQLLLDHGANPGATDPDKGNSALHWAVLQGNPEIATLLLQHRADVNARNTQGETPLDLARPRQGPAALATVAGRPQPFTASPAIPAAVPVPLPPGPLPPGNALPQPGSSPTGAPPTLEALLRTFGARDDLPRWDRIAIKRPSSNFSLAIFYRSTNDWSRYTLLDLLAVHYGLLAPRLPSQSAPRGSVRYNNSILSQWDVQNAFGLSSSVLAYPALHRLIIHRPSTNGTWTRLLADADAILAAQDGCQDLDLAWGDEVEVPEIDHLLNEPWRGFSLDALRTFQRCLTRTVSLVAKGETNTVTLGPSIEFHPNGLNSLLSNRPVSLQRALNQSKLVRASSDLSRILIRRAQPAPGAPAAWTVDATDPSPDAHLWLRDGDVIEIPDRDTAGRDQ